MELFLFGCANTNDVRFSCLSALHILSWQHMSQPLMHTCSRLRLICGYLKMSRYTLTCSIWRKGRVACANEQCRNPNANAELRPLLG